MAATCAACSGHIADGEKFVLAGTEVFHRRRECIARIAQSIGWQRQREIDRLRAELERARSQAAENERRLRNDVREERARAEAARELAQHARGLLATRDRVRDRAERERDQAVRDRDAAKRELALHQTIGTKTEIATANPEPETKDARDASEVRFSLLELDEP